MPTRVHTDAGLTASEVPAWETLPLDIYLLEQWNTPNLESPNETPDQRRRRLVRRFLDLGPEGREVYYKRTPVGIPWHLKELPNQAEQPEYTTAQPTPDEIETIPPGPALRAAPATLRNVDGPRERWCVWIRTKLRDGNGRCA
ncbi:hypothetical protein ASPSYDRAFT_86253 [Aspergillus sydowii CBS 593.65]|uniref:Uncharacterized protein n=1 Tax=Aspergillus sydowii CBS 593.65 TaxID=1036612 RepID=A0A1L9TT24_9EURO|nr:uncharacterized protein ASPSYDRAFT_86253 [Aspergillus sydowii CBS 593.65]OJJ62571.1 hypothetical protein ASPSYDRAFT_86253 [Aspergillus sydowii CBS 593.65]